jgi:uncharacterized protein (TIGR03083 family)
MSFSPTSEEIADRYGDARSRMMALAAGLTDGQAGLAVPGTPKWTVRDLLSHCVGCPIELAAGRFEGAGEDHWTQAQVDARRGRNVAELLAEWQDTTDVVEAAIRAGDVPVPVTLDILTHEQDLRGAIGAEPTPDGLAVRFLTDGFGGRATKVAAKAQLPPLRMIASDTDWSLGDPGGAHGEATEYEWARALTGRRSVSQVARFGWTGDPTPYLDLLSPFGPLPENDVIE